MRNDFDQELVLELGAPEAMTLRCAPQVPGVQLTNSQIKDLRIQEKRNFELENCKLKSFMKGASERGSEPSEFRREVLGFAFFETKQSKPKPNRPLPLLGKRGVAGGDPGEGRTRAELKRAKLSAEDKREPSLLEQMDIFDLSNKNKF